MDVVTARLITQQEPQKSSVANPSSIVVNKDVRKYKKKGISRKKDNRSLSDSDNRSSPNSISNSREELSNPVNQKYSGLVDCIRRMSQEEGIQGFFLGNSIIIILDSLCHIRSFLNLYLSSMSRNSCI
jgi:hypothetical protein